MKITEVMLLVATGLIVTACSDGGVGDSTQQGVSPITRSKEALVSIKTVKLCTEIQPNDFGGNGHVTAALINWVPGQTIRVRFLGGTPFLQAKVKLYANYWSKYCAINFAFVENGNADVRVNFAEGKGSWSIIGKLSMNNSINEATGQSYPSPSGATMNFGWFNASTPEEELKSVIIHEFGHAIGLAHEHQSPPSGIPWNKSAAYNYYKETLGWTSAQVDSNIFAKYSNPITQYPAYDKLSIMRYAIPKSLLTNPNAAVGWNTDLSVTDQEWSGNAYPYCPDYSSYRALESEYLVGDFDGDHKDNITVRRGSILVEDIDVNGYGLRCRTYDNKDNANGGAVDQYLVGDWDGDGKDNLAVRRGNTLFLDYNFDALADKIFSYGNGNSENEYMVGDWDGDGKDNIAVRRGNTLFLDYNFDGAADKVFGYGNGAIKTNGVVDVYLAGDWDGDGKTNIAVRRGSSLLLDYNFSGVAEKTIHFGNGDSEDQYLVGDWDGDGVESIAVRRGNLLFLDTDFNGVADISLSYGNGTK